MISQFRQDFNVRFTKAKYADLRRRLNERTRSQVDIRVAETPVFLPRDLVQTMADAGSEMIASLFGNREYMRATDAAIPAEFRAPGDEGQPMFLQVDFGLIRNGAGELEPRLVELQGFPSVYGFQAVLSEEYIAAYDLDPSLTPFFSHANSDAYWDDLRRAVLGTHRPEHVVLLEVEPELQKTLMDFHVHEDRLGIATVDIAKVRKDGRKLLYEQDGKWIPIRRIYNRSIADEIVRKSIKTGFDFRDHLDVEWAGHPNWYFRLSKFSLPWITHPYAPAAVFLDEWMDGKGRGKLPAERDRWVLKPLYSFAGKGVSFAPSEDDLQAIPQSERSQWLLQERVDFVPTVDTPEGPTQAEIRIMYLWPEAGEMMPVMSLVRMGRGKMMGVDHNRDKTWVGGSAGLFRRDLRR